MKSENSKDDDGFVHSNDNVEDLYKSKRITIKSIDGGIRI